MAALPPDLHRRTAHPTSRQDASTGVPGPVHVETTDGHVCDQPVCPFPHGSKQIRSAFVARLSSEIDPGFVAQELVAPPFALSSGSAATASPPLQPSTTQRPVIGSAMEIPMSAFHAVKTVLQKGGDGSPQVRI